MPGRPLVRKRHAQARRMRRFETERPSVGAVVSLGAAWTTVNVQRLPGLVLTVCCVVLLGFLFGSPQFFVYTAEITGNQLLSAEQICAAGGTDMLSIFFVAPRAVQQRILARYPALEQARVALGLPAEVRIHVLERRAQFIWEAEGRTYLTDERGVVLGDGPAPPGTMLIRATEGGAVADPAVLETVARLSPLLGGQLTFEYSLGQGVAWRTEQGWPVYFGVGGDLAGKVAVMRTMSAELARKGIEPQFLDVGVPSRPYYR